MPTHYRPTLPFTKLPRYFEFPLRPECTVVRDRTSHIDYVMNNCSNNQTSGCIGSVVCALVSHTVTAPPIPLRSTLWRISSDLKPLHEF